MRSTSAGQLVRGGQTTQHWVRMGTQVARYSAVVFASVFALVAILSLYQNWDAREFMMSRHYVVAGWQKDRPPYETRQEFNLYDQTLTSTYRNIRQSAEFRRAYESVEAKSIRAAKLGVTAGAIFFLLSIIVFKVSGRRLGQDNFVRGAKLVEPRVLRDWVDGEWASARRRAREYRNQPRFRIAGCEYPPNGPQAHTGIVATTGTGKTTMMLEMLQSIRAAGKRALIYDRTGAYTQAFYDPEKGDKILNPFDARSVSWSPFHDANSSAEFAKIFEVMIPIPADSKDSFWPKAARLVAESVARRLAMEGRTTNADLRQAIIETDPKGLMEIVEGLPADKILNPESGKMGMSVLATLLTELRFLEYLRDDGEPFSVRKWVQTRSGDPDDLVSGYEETRAGSFLFLSGHPEHDVVTRAISSAVMEIAGNALMGCQPSLEPELFFLIDELPSLNKMPFLLSQIAQVRQFGGAFVLGFQVLAQIEDIYGKQGALTIFGNLNTRVFGSLPDATTAKLCSDNLGMEDLVEHQENITVGAETVRDGVGFTTRRTERPIVSASELQRLEALNFYLTFPYGSPTSLVEIKPLKTSRRKKPRAERLVPYEGPGFGINALDPARFRARLRFLQHTQDEMWAEFTAWGKAGLQPIAPYRNEYPTLRPDDFRAIWDYFVALRLRGLMPVEIAFPEQPFAAAADKARQGLQGDLPPYPLGETRAAEEPAGASQRAAPGRAEDTPGTTPSGRPRSAKKLDRKRMPPKPADEQLDLFEVQKPGKADDLTNGLGSAPTSHEAPAPPPPPEPKPAPAPQAGPDPEQPEGKEVGPAAADPGISEIPAPRPRGEFDL